MQKSLLISQKVSQFLRLASVCLVHSVLAVRAQELILNGDFESGHLAPWVADQVAGSSLTLTGENSPFHSVYPAGSASLLLKDDDSSDFLDQPSIRQPFAGLSSLVFGFDFKMPQPGDPSPWYVAWNGENDTTAFFFRVGGADGVSVEFNLQKIADLKSNVWYHVAGWADAAAQKVEGTISNTLGDSATFQGDFPFGVKVEVNAVVVSDGDAARNPDVLLDNFYSRSVALQVSSQPNGDEVITWLATAFRLQSSPALFPKPQWTDIPGVRGAYTNTPSEKMRFFRLTHD